MTDDTDGTRRNRADGPALTISDLRERPTVTVEVAAKVLGLNRSTGYAAARRGEIPVVRIGRRMVVPTQPLLRMIGAEESRWNAS